MPKPAAVRRTSRRRATPRPTDFQDVLEGQITELCRDLDVEAKRMRQLQDQANELRAVIRRWTGRFDADATADR